ncbi:MAG: DUF4405 domain-containing protein [Deltaproteobacteria bacterium]|nr:DUF4405 domain-containing protein [Deltaproteobacteria bacterium]MBW1962476.1 DUF4405 domain-containing protein [Deltaproteobacteria bacterium]MBW2151052.1 DUF4405 domain-containing protein [Deltaproteobacteria bacterium]
MNIRRITSLTALLSFTIILISSFILYIVPQGRIAYWADWRLWGLSKEQWTNIHMINGLLFLISIFLHIYYNWNPIMTYLKNRAKQLKIFTREFNVALLLTALFTIGTYFAMPPFQWVIDLSDTIKEAAAKKYGEPPYGHAELSSLRTLAKRQGFDLIDAKERLKKAGIRFENENQKIKDVARLNGISPQQVYLAMKPERKVKLIAASPASYTPFLSSTGKNSSAADSALEGQKPIGLGKMTITEVCAKYNLNLQTALKNLADAGIQATPEDKMKKTAERHDTTPFDLLEAMR